MNTRIPCNYTVARFLPYPEAGEFVNVGVVAHSPTTGFFDFKLLGSSRTSRVGGFFPELDIAHYRDALKNCRDELMRMREEIGIHGKDSEQLAISPAVSIALFRELTKPRSTVIRFGSPGTALVENLAHFVDELFDRYVERMFAVEPEYQEEVMKRRVAQTLSKHRLLTHFREAKVGNEDYNVPFPFVFQPRIGHSERAIKPLNLAQDQGSKIIDHGEMWVNRIRRLQRNNTAPEKLLFPVHKPESTDARRMAAFREVCHELEQLGVTVVQDEDSESILRFARQSDM